MRSRHHTMRCVRTLATLLGLAALTWPGVAPVRASPARASVSLVRGWVHLPAGLPRLDASRPSLRPAVDRKRHSRHCWTISVVLAGVVADRAGIIVVYVLAFLREGGR